MKNLRGMLAVVGILCVSGWALAEGAAALKCPVSGKPAVAANSVEFDGGKVAFCCQNCPGAFEKDSKKFAAKAHHQMVAAGQFKQTACPFSGKDVAAGTEVEVDGVKVAFCCKNCQAKADKSTDKVALIFNDLSKGFKKN